MRELLVQSYINSEIFHKDLTRNSLLQPVRAQPQLTLRSPPPPLLQQSNRRFFTNKFPGECCGRFYGALLRPFFRVPQKEVGKTSSIVFFVLRTLLVTSWSVFLMLLSLSSSLVCQTPFAGLLLRQGDFLGKTGGNKSIEDRL